MEGDDFQCHFPNCEETSHILAKYADGDIETYCRDCYAKVIDSSISPLVVYPLDYENDSDVIDLQDVVDNFEESDEVGYDPESATDMIHLAGDVADE